MLKRKKVNEKFFNFKYCHVLLKATKHVVLKLLPRNSSTNKHNLQRERRKEWRTSANGKGKK
ncbi:CLUMA_CG014106, isoform A [Clunio marinus]|uniref:CLUMA_CG014106, isoform A n=1 Tax=Clunio marinus TaxID=568069 RepID=A0A1J1IKU4_9DIPT|nr:CLUMA_CG014106, isoform A [Clunio marinus]